MHISSALTLVRRAPVQSEVAMPRGQAVHGRLPVQAQPSGHWLKRALPGLILLTVLVLLGALFPVIF